MIAIDKPISSSIDIKVRLESNELKLFYVYSNDKIKKLKNKIQDELKYPINQQFLTFNHVLLDDEKTIQFYGIQYNSEISLEIKQIIHVIIKFNIDDELKNAVYDVYSSDMIISLKDSIQREKGIPVDEQSLRLNDIYLSNYKTFKDYSIQNNTVLKFISMMISCSTPNTKCTYDFRVCPENSIREVKRKIEQKTGYFANKMFLYLNKIPLDDYKQVKDYPFYNWSNINIVFRYMGG